MTRKEIVQREVNQYVRSLLFSDDGGHFSGNHLPMLNEATVYLVSDDPAMRQELCVAVAEGGFRVRTCKGIEGLLTAYARGTPACLVVDLQTIGPSKVELLPDFSRPAGEHPHILLVAPDERPGWRQIRPPEAVTVIVKPVPADFLLSWVTASLAAVCPTKPSAPAVENIMAHQANLSEREWQIMAFVVAGKSSKEIATELYLSIRTIENYRLRLMRKFHVHNAVELVRAVLTSDNSVEPSHPNP